MNCPVAINDSIAVITCRDDPAGTISASIDVCELELLDSDENNFQIEEKVTLNGLTHELISEHECGAGGRVDPNNVAFITAWRDAFQDAAKLLDNFLARK